MVGSLGSERGGMFSTANHQGATPDAMARVRWPRTTRDCRMAPLLLGCILVGTVLTACGSRPERARPITLRVVGLGLDTGDQLRHDALEEFTRNTGIQVDLIPTWGTSTEQLGLALQLLSQHTKTPDIYLIDSIWPGTLADELLDLTPYIGDEAHVHSLDLLKNDTVRGRIVSLPFYLNVGLLYYRSDLLKKYKYLDPPHTWDELEAMAERIQKGERATGNQGFWGYVWQGGPYEGLTCDALEWQASFGGGGIIEPEGTITVNNPRTARAFRMAAGWIGKISPPSVLSYNEADSLNAFLSGRAAFLRYWASGLATGDTGSGIRGRFTPAQLPAGPGGQTGTIGGFQLGVSRHSHHPQQAAQLVTFLTGTPSTIASGYSWLYSDHS